MSNLEQILHQMGKGKYAIPTFAQFVLEHGREYSPNTLPKGYRIMTPHRCFDNAFHLAKKKGLTYVEGYAEVEGVPILHGWCVDGEQVIDVTATGLMGYYGVPLNLKLVQRFRIEKRNTFSIIDDWLNGFRLLSNLNGLAWQDLRAEPVPETA